jgi:predicted amidohydrolase YtcJ
VEVDGAVVDVDVAGGRIAAVGRDLGQPDPVTVIEGNGGALLPGLHDHHLHLLAMAAAGTSVRAGPPAIIDRQGLAVALDRADRQLPEGRWLRAIGYHESVAGDLDRAELDRLVPARPARLQHRSGARWVLNSTAIDRLGLDDADLAGLERDAAGRLTGRLHRADDWLRRRIADPVVPDLSIVGAELARRGVTGVTDATPYTDLEQLRPLAEAVASGALPQRVVVTGGSELAGAPAPPGLEWGPVKIVIDDADYPPLDPLADRIRVAHRHSRNVAVHCVTRTALALALAAWDAAGARPGDRVEHGSVVPPELRSGLRRHRLTVVTQPSLVAERGDDYLRDVDADDRPHLYPCRRLLEDGVPVAGSSDAPCTDGDPWAAIETAVTRRTRTGAVLGADEAVAPERALDLFLGDPHRPGGPPRAVATGARADLCLLATPRAEALRRPADVEVVLTIRAGRILSRRRSHAAG